MARRRRSLLDEILASYRKSKRAAEAAERQRAATAQKWKAEQIREDQRRKKQQAQRDAARIRDGEAQQRQTVREQTRQAQEQRRSEQEAARVARDRQQREAVERREQSQAELSDLQRTAEADTEKARERIAGIERLLMTRLRQLPLAGPFAELERAREDPSGYAAAIRNAIQGGGPAAWAGHLDDVVYLPEAAEVVADFELPREVVVPPVVAYRVNRTKRAIQSEPRRPAEVKNLYERLLAGVVLRTLADLFEASRPQLVDSIVVNGHVSAVDRSTGQAVRPCLISVSVERGPFTKLILDEPELDPVACLRQSLNAIVSPHPGELEGVRPVLQYDLSRYKLVEGLDVLAGLDSRPDLLSFKPVEFEHLIRTLFERMGMSSWVTQASKDDGVDAVAVNEDPVLGGLCIIQAKRYSRIVGVEAVQALAGVMNDKAAAKGILVTTSWVGKASRDFAQRNGRIQIIDGRNLKLYLKEHMDMDVLISLRRVPPDWSPSDLV